MKEMTGNELGHSTIENLFPIIGGQGEHVRAELSEYKRNKIYAQELIQELLKGLARTRHTPPKRNGPRRVFIDTPSSEGR